MIIQNNNTRRPQLPRFNIKIITKSNTQQSVIIASVGIIILATTLNNIINLSQASPVRVTRSGQVQVANQQQLSSNNMRSTGNNNKPKRSAQASANRTGANSSSPVKRFKSSFPINHLILTEPHRLGVLVNRQPNATSSSNDINNNSGDINNNGIPDVGAERYRNHIKSVNGTIDLSQYEQSDVDRLYGDALLVYLKNFNETLPARRETISINGTTTRIPVYRSDPQPSARFSG